MQNQRSYKVLKPVNLDGYGTVEPGNPETVQLHPRQATFLVTGGVLKPIDTIPEKTVKKEAAK